MDSKGEAVSTRNRFSARAFTTTERNRQVRDKVVFPSFDIHHSGNSVSMEKSVVVVANKRKK